VASNASASTGPSIGGRYMAAGIFGMNIVARLWIHAALRGDQKAPHQERNAIASIFRCAPLEHRGSCTESDASVSHGWCSMFIPCAQEIGDSKARGRRLAANPSKRFKLSRRFRFPYGPPIRLLHCDAVVIAAKARSRRAFFASYDLTKVTRSSSSCSNCSPAALVAVLPDAMASSRACFEG
jgi:hypothetical protein